MADRLLGTVIACTALLMGCGSDAADGAEPSVACLESMEAAAEVTGNANAAIAKTLTACDSPESWLAALERHPGAMGLSERAEIGDLELRVACSVEETVNTPVCLDYHSAG